MQTNQSDVCWFHHRVWLRSFNYRISRHVRCGYPPSKFHGNHPPSYTINITSNRRVTRYFIFFQNMLQKIRIMRFISPRVYYCCEIRYCDVRALRRRCWPHCPGCRCSRGGSPVGFRGRPLTRWINLPRNDNLHQSFIGTPNTHWTRGERKAPRSAGHSA